ncbi:hypothetical protein QJS10_CPB18g00276 [Acorus calamus]|uniref:Uncharacterized protein n=1 Tax=Acorus calamus TaxID=4465 RepID=A0AAV9CNQ6_ACOCL|nr:hypothetical protein QJS10_CPB18g00276 [Acorus calamus]
MVKGTARRQYRLGKQKTIRLDKDYCNMDEIFEKVGKLVKWGENDALNMQFKISGREEYDTLATESDMLVMFNMHQKSPKIEIFITVEHDVHPTPDNRGFPIDEIFEMEAEFCGADVSMEDLSSFLDREENSVDYSVFYDSNEDRYRVVTKMTQEKRKHNVSIEELDDNPHVAATTAHENIFRSAIPSDQPTPLDEPFFEEEVHEELIQCEESSLMKQCGRHQSKVNQYMRKQCVMKQCRGNQ